MIINNIIIIIINIIIIIINIIFIIHIIFILFIILNIILICIFKIISPSYLFVSLLSLPLLSLLHSPSLLKIQSK